MDPVRWVSYNILDKSSEMQAPKKIEPAAVAVSRLCGVNLERLKVDEPTITSAARVSVASPGGIDDPKNSLGDKPSIKQKCLWECVYIYIRDMCVFYIFFDIVYSHGILIWYKLIWQFRFILYQWDVFWAIKKGNNPWDSGCIDGRTLEPQPLPWKKLLRRRSDLGPQLDGMGASEHVYPRVN